MFLSTLQIRNFRNYRAEKFLFKKGTNTIIGENDSGKTNALTALRILLDDSYYYSNKMLKETDFFNNLKNGWQGEWIIISATFSGITQEEAASEICGSLSINSSEYDDVESVNSIQNLLSNNVEGVGSLSLFIRPKKSIRKQLFNASDEGDYFKIDEIRKGIRLSDYEFYYTSRSNTDFTIDENYYSLLGNLESYEVTDPGDDDEILLGSKIDMSDVYQHLSVVYVDALRDVLREMKNNRNPVKRVVESIKANISSGNIDSLKVIIQNLNQTITDIPEINSIGESLNIQLNTILGSIYSPNLLLTSSLSDDMSDLSKFLSMKADNGLELELLGLGHLNMIYLALKIVEFEACRSRELLNIMLVEEPEAHIHHHIQKTLFEGLNLKDNYTQILMTTHSVHLAESSEISRMNVLKTCNGSTNVMSPSKNLNNFAKEKLKKENLNLIQAVERFLDVKRNGLLFSKGIILVEGDAEEILIPQITKKVFGVSLDELGIGLVNIGSTAFEYIACLFHDDRIKRKCAIVTDLDKQKIPESSPLYRKEAERLGISRRIKLTRLFENNNWVNSFYANTTFELEFIDRNTDIDNIEEYLIPIVNSTFKKDETVSSYTADLRGEDTEQRNLAMLKLAREVGKGWFSIELGQNLNEFVNMPFYIIDAVAFACQETIDITVIRKILLYVLDFYDVVNNSGLQTISEKLQSDNESEIKNAINDFSEYFSEEEENAVRLLNQIKRYQHFLDSEV